ncbi:hypothetical protein A4D02_27650 [Niastella koreensis]|uniref:DUF2231 domain-containing protein n=2 Tax=Niastella koreensis TaxID=354356 RepID=G8TI15_NIAKG|nr:DUF2231 domain-containing protein [Niastella koreensis]AEV99618.1 hypothetical protein Niako_3294 [Niastella koreensis GR20-10]OQP50206.1 hypothetical protein A4D02_27650 [Niastella koreensis]
MSQVHLHLLITHLPVFGSILGALVLGYGLWANSDQTKNAAYFLFIISAIGASIAYATGEGAEDTVEKIQGVSKNLIDQHEDAAVYALISFIVLGIMSVIAFVITRYKTSLVRYISMIIFILSLISFGLAARTGYLGGQIRHTEISNGTLQNNRTGEARQKDDD